MLSGDNSVRKRFFCKFSKLDLFDCQESMEMVWLWLFVTSPVSVMGGEQLIRFTYYIYDYYYYYY